MSATRPTDAANNTSDHILFPDGRRIRLAGTTIDQLPAAEIDVTRLRATSSRLEVPMEPITATRVYVHTSSGIQTTRLPEAIRKKIVVRRPRILCRRGTQNQYRLCWHGASHSSDWPFDTADDQAIGLIARN